MPSAKAKCSICQKLLNGDTRVEITLACGHTFHRECAKKRLFNNKSTDCPICRQKDALEHAIRGGPAIDQRQGKSAGSTIEKKVIILVSVFTNRRTSYEFICLP